MSDRLNERLNKILPRVISDQFLSRKRLGFADAIYGDLRSASVSFRGVGTTNALHFGGLLGRGERTPPALGSGLAWRRRS